MFAFIMSFVLLLSPDEWRKEMAGDWKSQAAAWLGYIAMNTPRSVTPPQPTPIPVVVPPSKPTPPKYPLNPFGQPVLPKTTNIPKN